MYKYEIHVNISKKPYTYEWETVARYRNRAIAYEKCEEIRNSGRWAVVHENDDTNREIGRTARQYYERYETETVMSYERENWGSAGVYSVSTERIYEAYSEYSESREYW